MASHVQHTQKDQEFATARRPSGHSDISGSFDFGWFGILLWRENLPKFIAILRDFKALWRLYVTVTRGQGQCPVLNFEDGDNHLADAISWWWATFDGGV